MKQSLSWVILLFSLTPQLKAEFVTIFQEHLRTYSDFIPLGEELEIHVQFSVNNGKATVTLPPELSYTGTYTVWNGPVESITFQGQTATITVKEGVLGGEVWFFAFAKPLSELPDSPPEVDITITGQETRSFSFKMLYQKVSVTSDTEGPVTAGDIITYTVRISTYPREDLEKSRLTLYPPLGTDLLLDSITGPKDAVLSGGPSLGYSLKWDSNPPTTLEVIYKVQVWDIYIIHPSVKEIVTDSASYRIDAKGVLRRADNVTGDPIEDINFFSSSELSEPLVNKLERNELELTLTPSKTILEVDEEFTVTATIKTINFSRFENARLNEPSIKFLGDQVAQLIESPTTFLPPLTNNKEGSLEYKFKALAEGTFRISAEAMATATGRTDPTTSDPVETEEICVGCQSLEINVKLLNRSESAPIDLGEEVVARVTVSASDELEGEFSGVAFKSLEMALEFPDKFEEISKPSNLDLGTLEASDSFIFDWKLKAVKSGDFELKTSELMGKNPKGEDLTIESATLTGSIEALKVEIVFPEEQLKLMPKESGDGLSEDAGYEPLEFDVMVRVTVPKGGDPVKNVSFQGFDANDGGLDVDLVEPTGILEFPFVDAFEQPVPFPVGVAAPRLETGTNERVLTSDGPPVDFKVRMSTTRPGYFDFAALVTASPEGGGKTITQRGNKVTQVLGDILLTVQLEIVNTPARITEGEAVEITGVVENITLTETIKLHPVRVINGGQGIPLGPVEIDDPLPVAGQPGIFNPILTPTDEGKRERFRVRVKTVSLPGFDQRELARKSVIVDFEVGGKVIDSEGKERDLLPENIAVEWGNGRHETEGATFLRAQVDPDYRETEVLEPADFFLISAGKAMERLASGGGEAIAGIPQLIGGLPDLFMGVANLGGAVVAETWIASHNAARYMWAWRDYQIDVWLNISQETKIKEIDLISSELALYYGDKFETLEEVKALVDQGISGYFEKGIDYQNRAYDAAGYGFNIELANITAEPFKPVGKFATEEALTAYAILSWVSRSSRAPHVLEEVAEQRELFVARAEKTAAEATEEIAKRGEPGDPRATFYQDPKKAIPRSTKVTAKQAQDGFVIDPVSDDNLIRMTKVEDGGMSIYAAVRSRADETQEWMRTSRGITPKPMTFKPKNVNADDIAYLGYRDGVGYGDVPGVPPGDRGATIIAEPIPRDEVLRRLDAAGADQKTRDRVIKRHDLRWEEWYGVEKCCGKPDIINSDFTNLARNMTRQEVDGREILAGTLDVPKRGTVPQPNSNFDTTGPGVLEAREFELRGVKDPPDNDLFGPEGRQYYECWLEDDTGIIENLRVNNSIGDVSRVKRRGAKRRIAGDIDIVSVGYADGRALTPGVAADTIAANLLHAIYAQHPWSSSLSFKKLFDKYINAHRWHELPEKRGEPLLIYVNGERRIGWFHPTRIIDGKNPLQGFIWADGGVNDIDNIVKIQQDSRGFTPSPYDENPPLVKPTTSVVREAIIKAKTNPGDNLIATCTIQTAKNAGRMYRLSQNDNLESRNQDGSWTIANPRTLCETGGILVLPETYLSAGVEAGTRRLPIVETLLGYDWRAMFEVGTKILLDPGGALEDLFTVTEHGSLIIDRPLEHDYPIGTRIVALPGEGDDEFNPIEIEALNQTYLGDNISEFEIRFRSYVFDNVLLETSTDMINWQAAELDHILGANPENDFLRIAHLGDEVSLKLQVRTSETERMFFRIKIIEPE